ncbi:MAG TPA: hypothetical protein VE990_02040 [Acidimicrobiales bacterium]|nr:hypothetical protein [Acidimicrobiales bacterium]
MLRIAFRPGQVLRYRYQGMFKTPGPDGTVNQTVMNADTSLTASDAGGHGASGSAPAAATSPRPGTWSVELTFTNLRRAITLAGLRPSLGSSPGPLKLQLLIDDDGRVVTGTTGEGLGAIGSYPNPPVLPPLYNDAPGVSQFLAILPDRAVGVGDCWRSSFTDLLGFMAQPDHLQVTSTLARYETVHGLGSAVVRSTVHVPIAFSGNLPATAPPVPGPSLGGHTAYQGQSTNDVTTWLALGDAAGRIERVEATDRYDWTETTDLSVGSQPPTTSRNRQSGTVSTRLDRIA